MNLILCLEKNLVFCMPVTLACNSVLKVEGVSERALQIWELTHIYLEDMYGVLNCHNVAKMHRVLLG
jgi:hypothetical protein